MIGMTLAPIGVRITGLMHSEGRSLGVELLGERYGSSWTATSRGEGS